MLTAQFGQIITGSLVNLILIVSVMTCGLSVGLSVALVSPVAAKLLSIGPLWSIIPFILIGNATLVVLWHYIGRIRRLNHVTAYIIALITAAAAKFTVLYIGIVKIAIPFLLNLQDKQAAAVSSIFSLPQLLTASIGGIVAVIILPLIHKAIKNRV